MPLYIGRRDRLFIPFYGGNEIRMTNLARITLEAGKRGGQPTIRGLRITVYDVLHRLAEGTSEAELLEDFPELETADIRACLAYAADREHNTATLLAE